MRALSWHDALVMDLGARKRLEREQRTTLQAAALVSSSVYNWGGMRGKSFRPKTAAQLFPGLFDGGGGKPSLEHIRQEKRRHERFQKRMRRRKEAGQPLTYPSRKAWEEARKDPDYI